MATGTAQTSLFLFFFSISWEHLPASIVRHHTTLPGRVPRGSFVDSKVLAKSREVTVLSPSRATLNSCVVPLNSPKNTMVVVFRKIREGRPNSEEPGHVLIGEAEGVFKWETLVPPELTSGAGVRAPKRRASAGRRKKQDTNEPILSSSSSPHFPPLCFFFSTSWKSLPVTS